jgi:hypothetical protein
MPLWPVQLQSWPRSNFTKVEPQEALVDYDGPITFTFYDDDDGGLMLAHSVGADGGLVRFIVAPTSPATIARLKSAALSVRAALDQPVIWLLDTAADGTITSQWAGTLSAIPSEVIPAEGVMLLPSLEPRS